MNSKIAAAQAEKEKGNEAFRSGDAKDALKYYHFAKLHIKGLMNLTDEQKSEIQAIEFSVTLNMTAVYVKLNMWDKAVIAASSVLEKDPKNVKALYRRGKAYLEMGNTDSAREDLVAAIKLSPNDVPLRDEYQKLQEKELKQSSQAIKVFKNLFSDLDTNKTDS